MTKIHIFSCFQIIIFSCFCFFSSVGILQAQPVNNYVEDVVAPSATASSLGVYADIPVGHNSGVPSVGVPLHTIRCGTLRFPLQLSYHAGGIRPAALASWTGDFAIHPGSISRTIQGTADERDNGYLSVGTDIFVDGDGCVQGPNGYINNDMADGLIDSEPDIFTVSIHQGLNFKFYFDAQADGQGKPVLIPQQDVKILHTLEGSISNPFRLKNFTIIDATGVQYEFGDIDDGNPATEIMRVGQAFLFPNATNWHLKKITSADGKYFIAFNYQKERYRYYSRASRGGGLGLTANEINTTIHTVEGYRLSEISTSTQLETITFVPGAVREDVESYQSGEETKVLDHIDIACGVFCKSYQFTYDYFKDNEHPTEQWEDNRLRLDAVQEQSCDGTITDIPAYTFDYYRKTGNENYLTNRVSTAIDHWGYANAEYENPKNGLNMPYTRLEYINTFGDDIVAIKGSSDRETNEQAMQWGNLQQINYPMGGHVAFEFEANEYYSTEDFTTIEPLGFELDGSDCASGSLNLHDTETISISSADIDDLVFTWRNERIEATGCCTGDTRVEIRMYQGANLIETRGAGIGCDEDSPAVSVTQGYLKELFQELPNNGAGTYTFELHLARINSNFIIEREVTQALDDNKEVGGLRVTKITRSDGLNINNDIIKTFNYHQGSIPTRSSGVLYNQPKYGYIYNYRPNFCTTDVPPNSDQETTHTFQEFGIYPLSSFEGQHISYSEVRELHDGNGFIYYSYDEEPELSDIGATEFPVVVQARVNAGQLLYQAISKDNGNILNSETRTVFTEAYDNSVGTCIKTFRIDNDAAGVAPFVVYNIRTKPHRYATVTVIQDGVITTTTSEYDVNKDYLFPVAEYMTNSDGKTYRTEYLYSPDYVNSFNPLNTEIRDDLVERHILLPAWKIIKKVDGIELEEVDGQEIRYSWFNLDNGTQQDNHLTPSIGFPRPYQVSRYEESWDEMGNMTGPGMSLQATFDAYDGDGNIASITEDAWLPLTYTWSKGRLLTKTFDQHTSQNEYHDNTYLLEKQTAVDGQEVVYEYDQLMRPTVVKARNEHVITSFDYHYTTDISNEYNYFQSSTTYTPVTGSELENHSQRQYVDGLGRVVQSNQIAHSPSSRDVITAVEYDNRGRVSRTYEPVHSFFDDGTFFNISANAPHTLTEYEPSPLNRTSAVTPPNWTATTTTYGTNNNNISIHPGMSGNYLSGSLNTTTLEDGDGRQTISYTDTRGRQVAMYQTDGSSTAITRYVYDDKDRLTKTFPPDNINFNENLIFEQLYDGNDNLRYSKVPDKQAVSMYYDERDLAVVMQDGKMAAENRWMLTEYDNYGRPTQTGFENNPVLDMDNQPVSNGIDNLLTETFYDGFDGSGTLGDPIYKGRVRKTRTRILNGNFFSNEWLESTIAYDDHGRTVATIGNNHLENGAENTSFSYDYADNVLSTYREHGQGNPYFTRIIENDMTYDHKGRLKTTSHSIDGIQQDISEMQYDIEDRVSSKHLGGFVGSALQQVNYGYNERNFLVNINNPFNLGDDLFAMRLRYNSIDEGFNEAETQENGNIAQIVWATPSMNEAVTYGFSYDYLNRLTWAEYGTADNDGTSFSATVELNNHYSSSYTYEDARGNIQNITRQGMINLNGTWTPQEIDDMTLHYKTNSNQLDYIEDMAAAPICPGIRNLSGSETGNIVERGTVIASTQSVEASAMVDYLASECINLNANFEVKLGAEFLADIEPCSNEGFGFVDDVDGDTYLYDENGNMTYDPDKNITVFYNYLSLPYRVEWDDGRWMELVYDAGGMKLTKTRSDNYVKEYVGGIEYENNNLDAIYFEDGRAILDGGAFKYQYCLKDNLGNTRVMFEDGGNGVVSIVQENHYYSFGLLQNGEWSQPNVSDYTFGGKELNEDFGLGWQDFGARWRDPAIIGWGQIDALAGDYISWSPYNFVANNPLKFTDPDGRKIEYGENVSKEDKKALKKQFRRLRRGSKTFRKMWKDLKTSDNLHTIHTTTSDGLQVSTGEKTKEGVGSDIYLHPTENNVGIPHLAAIGHEMGHAWRGDKGLDPIPLDEKPGSALALVSSYKFSQYEEFEGTHIENIIRTELGLELREEYGEVEDNHMGNLKPATFGVRFLDYSKTKLINITQDKSYDYDGSNNHYKNLITRTKNNFNFNRYSNESDFQ